MLRNETKRPSRLRCLDVFRGLAMGAMIMVNNPGSWKHVYGPLRHASWHGCTVADLVFPFFLFIAGASLAMTMEKLGGEDGGPSVRGVKYVLKRALILFGLGLLLNFLSLLPPLLSGGEGLDFTTFRIMGVLQRISLCYLAGGIIVFCLKTAGQWTLAFLILIGYWAGMCLVPVPGYGAADFSAQGNLAAYLDRLLLGPAHLYRGGPGDPEGLLSTLPAVVTLLAGFFTGRWIRTQPFVIPTALKLGLAGLGCLAGGYLWGLVFPINKTLWTSSYVVLTAGWALVFFSVCFTVIEIRGLQRWARPLEVLGRNAILVFTASSVGARILLAIVIGSGPERLSIHARLYQNWFATWAGQTGGSLAFAFCHLFVWWLVCAGLYRRGCFLKI